MCVIGWLSGFLVRIKILVFVCELNLMLLLGLRMSKLFVFIGLFCFVCILLVWI